MNIKLEKGTDLGGGFRMKYTAYYKLEKLPRRIQYVYENPEINLKISCYTEIEALEKIKNFYRAIAEKHHGCIGYCSYYRSDDKQRELANLAVEHIDGVRRSSCDCYFPAKKSRLSKKERQEQKRLRGGCDHEER